MKNNKSKYGYSNLKDKFIELHDIIYPLSQGINKYSSQFGLILEGVIKKDFYTLQTILVLLKYIEMNCAYLGIFSGSILDLSRRMFEDMIAISYINIRGRTKYSKRLVDYIAVEDKVDLDFLDSYNLKVEESYRNDIEQKFSKLSNEMRERKNWAGLDIEGMIEYIAKKTNMSSFQKGIVYKQYLSGNRKNHVSSVDVWVQGSYDQLTLNKIAEGDISMGLITASTSILWVALILVEHRSESDEHKGKLVEFWKKVNNGKEPPESILKGKD